MRFVKGLLTAAGLVLIGIAAADLFETHFVRRYIERDLTGSFGVPAKLGATRISLVTGSVALSDLELANPEGFPEGPAFRIDEARLQWNALRALQGERLLSAVRIDGMTVFLAEEDEETNIEALVAAAPEPEEGELFRIGRLVAEDVRFAAAGESNEENAGPGGRVAAEDLEAAGSLKPSTVAVAVLRAVLDSDAAEGEPDIVESLVRRAVEGLLDRAFERNGPEDIEALEPE